MSGIRSTRVKKFFAVFIIFTTLSCMGQQFPASDHYDGSRFSNLDSKAETAKGFGALLKWKLGPSGVDWPIEKVRDLAIPDIDRAVENKDLRITFINHATLLGPVDVALLPIGAYEPRWFMTDSHMNPDDAIQAHLDLHAKRSIGMHFGTFRLTDEGIGAPEIDLKAGLLKSGIPNDNFEVPRNGQTFSL